MSNSDPIVAVYVDMVDKALPRELRLGPFTVARRTYAVVRIETESGLTGYAYSQTRGAPIAEIVERLLTPVLVGQDSASIKARWQQCFGSTSGVGRTGLVMRAISLVDIALWDIQAKRAGLPLHQLLGGVRDEVPAIFVAGYPSTLHDVDEAVAAATGAADQGFELIKIARSADPQVTARVLTEVDRVLPERARVIVDGSWAFGLVDEPLDEVSRWPRERVAWIEDPFPAEASEKYRRFVERSPVPVSAGDEVTDPETLVRLVEHSRMDLLRIDVATIGGITAAVRLLDRLEPMGVSVSTHICPEVSVHLAGAHSAVVAVETFDVTGNRFDPAHELFTGGPDYVAGHAVLSDRPGLGLTPAY